MNPADGVDVAGPVYDLHGRVDPLGLLPFAHVEMELRITGASWNAPFRKKQRHNSFAKRFPEVVSDKALERWNIGEVDPTSWT